MAKIQRTKVEELLEGPQPMRLFVGENADGALVARVELVLSDGTGRHIEVDAEPARAQIAALVAAAKVVWSVGA